MEDFCLAVFNNADKSDRESPVQPPDISLANRFYVASLFLDVLSHLQEGNVLPPDLEEKRKYAKYRTVQIRNRVALVIESTAETSVAPVVVVVDDHPGPVTRNPEISHSAKKVSESSSSGFKYADSSSSSVLVPSKASSQSVSKSSAVAAKKKLLQAISAIDFTDYQTAVDLCSEAISLLR